MHDHMQSIRKFVAIAIWVICQSDITKKIGSLHDLHFIKSIADYFHLNKNFVAIVNIIKGSIYSRYNTVGMGQRSGKWLRGLGHKQNDDCKYAMVWTTLICLPVHSKALERVL